MDRFPLMLHDLAVIIVDVALALPGVAGRRYRSAPQLLAVRPLAAPVANQFLDIGRRGRRLHWCLVQIRFQHPAIIQPGHRQDNPDIHIRQRIFDGVATFQHRHIGPQFFGQPGVSLRRHSHIGQRIAVVIILPRGVDDQVRLEIGQHRQDQLVEHTVESRVCCSGRQRNIDRRHQGGGAAGFTRKTGPRIQSAPILMERNKQGVRIMVINILGSIAMMHIRIDDRHPAQAILFPQRFNHHRFDVDGAKPPGSVHHPHRMVAGRAHQRKRPGRFTAQHRFCSRDRSASRHPVCIGNQGSNVWHADVNPLQISD